MASDFQKINYSGKQGGDSTARAAPADDAREIIFLEVCAYQAWHPPPDPHPEPFPKHGFWFHA